MTDIVREIQEALTPALSIASDYQKEVLKEIAYLEGRIAQLSQENESLRLANAGCVCRSDPYFTIQYKNAVTGVWEQFDWDHRKFSQESLAEYAADTMRKVNAPVQYRVVGPGISYDAAGERVRSGNSTSTWWCKDSCC